MKLKNMNMKERMKYFNVTGLSMALINNRQISMAEGFGVLETSTNKKVSNESIFNACSISKFVTSMLVLKLTERGILDLDEDINERLIHWKIPDDEFFQNRKITLRSLLSHQSGIVDPNGSFSGFTSTNGIPSMVDILEGKTSYCNEPIKMKYIPESDFQYSDAGFCIIQLLIEDVTGKAFDTVMNELIFEPLHMKNSTYNLALINEQFSYGHNKNGSLVECDNYKYPYPAASGLWTTPTDLAILVIELMNSLKGESVLGISASKTEIMISSQGCKEWVGLGVFLEGKEQEIEISSLGWGAGFQCMMVACPYVETGAVIMTNTDLEVHQLKGIIGEIYHFITS